MPAPDLKPQVPGETPAASPTDDAQTNAPAGDQAEAQTEPTAEQQQAQAEQPPAEQQPEAPQADPALVQVVAGTAESIISTLKQWTDEQLQQLRTLEAAGKARTTVLAAIDAELKRNTPPVPPKAPGPVRVDRQPTPVLTDAGWVVPEPIEKA